MPYDGDQTPIQAVVIDQADLSNDTTPVQMAFFDDAGDPWVPSMSTVMPNQAVFSGADVTALKVELNALRTKLINAGLMSAT